MREKLRWERANQLAANKPNIFADPPGGRGLLRLFGFASFRLDSIFVCLVVVCFLSTVSISISVLTSFALALVYSLIYLIHSVRSAPPVQVNNSRRRRCRRRIWRVSH